MVQSDEISLLLTDFSSTADPKRGSTANLQKIVSITAQHRDGGVQSGHGIVRSFQSEVGRTGYHSLCGIGRRFPMAQFDFAGRLRVPDMTEGSRNYLPVATAGREPATASCHGGPVPSIRMSGLGRQIDGRDAGRWPLAARASTGTTYPEWPANVAAMIVRKYAPRGPITYLHKRTGEEAGPPESSSGTSWQSEAPPVFSRNRDYLDHIYSPTGPNALSR